jgi:hypothetical protein
LLEEMMEPGQTGKSAQVEVDTLDGILAELNVQKVDFIKMNIEGAEIEVLKGAVGTLKNNSVALAIEAHHLVGGAPTHETVVPWLKEAGFDAFLGRKGVVYARNAR